MAEYCAHVKKEFALDTQVLDLGGGIGVRYLDSDPEVSVRDIVLSVSNALREVLDAAGLPMPRAFMEPGRSLVADAGVTLYSVGAVKEIAGVKNYVSVNGGMADNPRFALYGAPYTVMLANRASEECDYRCTVAGRCCESGDVIQEGVMIPRPERGDVLAVLTTGAYNYSMASHYNRLAKPPIVVLKDGESRVAVRRETLKDLLSCDVVLELKEEE
jgi:diaminopimelate decarboxylase